MQIMPVQKNIDAIFDDWQIDNQLFENYSLDYWLSQESSKSIINKRFNQLYKRLSDHKKSLQQLQYITENMHKVSTTTEFFYFFKEKKFTSKKINKEETQLSVDKIINKYNNFARFFCASEKRIDQDNFLYTLANEFFFSIVNTATASTFKKLFLQEKYYPLARFIYSIIWRNFSAKGWSTWHKSVIEKLQAQTQQGKEIVYFAGGTDFFQLLNYEIFNIRIIDPFIPRQKKFYSKGWRFLLQGEIGDQITYPLKESHLILKRVSYEKTGTFTVGEKRLQRLTTQWAVFKPNKTIPCGTITFERRTLKQEDFLLAKNKIPLMSFNELYFITTAGDCSWGIDLQKLPSNLKIFTKQLKRPMTKNMLINMQKIDSYDNNIEFIQLGSSID